jgi:hypothetical protein
MFSLFNPANGLRMTSGGFVADWSSRVLEFSSAYF